MAVIVEIIRPTEDGVWKVAVDGRCVVAFYGASAQQLAEYHRDALEELLASEDGNSCAAMPAGQDAALPVDTLGEPIGFWPSSVISTSIN